VRLSRYASVMTEEHDDQGAWSWPEPPVAGGETATLLGSLERQRATFAWKAGGLDAAGLRATTAASALTLGGLLVHLARVEDGYFSVRLLGRDRRPPFATMGWDDDWRWAAEQTPEDLYGVVGEDPPDWRARPPWPPLSEADLRLLERTS